MKFLTDAQTPLPFVSLLRQLEWNVRTVYEENTQDEKDDVTHLINARSQDRTFITFDLLRGESGARVAAELILNGGKVIQITRGPDQPLLRALGRLFFHHPEWFPHLDKNDGVAVISDIRNPCALYTPEEYSQRISRSSQHHFDEYIKYWEEKKMLPVRRRRLRRGIPSEQGRLLDENEGVSQI